MSEGRAAQVAGGVVLVSLSAVPGFFVGMAVRWAVTQAGWEYGTSDLDPAYSSWEPIPPWGLLVWGVASVHALAAWALFAALATGGWQLISPRVSRAVEARVEASAAPHPAYARYRERERLWGRYFAGVFLAGTVALGLYVSVVHWRNWREWNAFLETYDSPFYEPEPWGWAPWSSISFGIAVAAALALWLWWRRRARRI